MPKDPEDIRAMLKNGYSADGLADRYRTDMEQITREYGLMAKLKGNANVVYCDDLYCEKAQDGIGWTIYIKMELLTPLSDALGNYISELETVKLGMDLCKVLSACKEHGILHRDIKPGNIMVARDGNYKLGDFGVAKTAEITSGGTKTGTYGYMAPEVYNNRPYGTLVDIYSLGMVMYWMLNERCGPFLPLPPTVPSAMELEEAKQRRFDGDPLPAPAHGSEALKRIVLKACAYDPVDRYQTPEALYEDLEQVQRSLSQTTWSVPAPTTQPPVWKEEPSVSGNSWQQENEETEVACPEAMEPYLEKTAVSEQVEKPKINKQSDKKTIALVLAIFPSTGTIGIHDFYLGNYLRGVLKFLTGNYFLIGWIVDIILLSTGKYKNADGTVLK